MKVILLDLSRLTVYEMASCVIGIETDMGIDFLLCPEHYTRNGGARGSVFLNPRFTEASRKVNTERGGFNFKTRDWLSFENPLPFYVHSDFSTSYTFDKIEDLLKIRSLCGVRKVDSNSIVVEPKDKK